MLSPAAPKATALLALCLVPVLLGPVAAQPVALPPLADIENGSATVASDLTLPATVQELCAAVTVPAPQLPAGFSKESLGPLQRVNTTTASWGYHRCARKGGGRQRGNPRACARQPAAARPDPGLATRRRRARPW